MSRVPWHYVTIPCCYRCELQWRSFPAYQHIFIIIVKRLCSTTFSFHRMNFAYTPIVKPDYWREFLRKNVKESWSVDWVNFERIVFTGYFTCCYGLYHPTVPFQEIVSGILLRLLEKKPWCFSHMFAKPVTYELQKHSRKKALRNLETACIFGKKFLVETSSTFCFCFPL